MQTSPAKNSQLSMAKDQCLSTGGLLRLVTDHPSNNSQINNQNLMLQVTAVKVMQGGNDGGKEDKKDKLNIKVRYTLSDGLTSIKAVLPMQTANKID